MKRKLKRLEQVAGTKESLPIVLYPDKDDLYEYQGKKYTKEELDHRPEKFIIVTFSPYKYLGKDHKNKEVDLEGLSDIEAIEKYLKN